MTRRLIRYLTGLVIAALIALGLHLFCIGSYSISTRSMSDVLQESDRVFVKPPLSLEGIAAWGYGGEVPMLISKNIAEDFISTIG